MLHKKALRGVVFLSLVFVVCPLMHGQATGSFSGTVSDKAGAVISGATVTVASQETGLSREAKTDDSGHYLIPLLPVSNYTVRVQSQGFQTAEQKDIRLQIDEHPELNFSLAPASVSTNVEVSGTAVAVETTNPTLGQVITSEQVAELPLNGRDFVQLATLTPGVTQETNPSSFFNGGPSSEVSARGTYSLSVGGSRAQSTDWLLDGNDNNELTAGGIAILPSIDAIQEFKVLTYNYSAEWGTRAGPTVLVTTKSGTNQFHGSLFEFFRNTKLDARSYFASSKEQFNLNQFGGALGGAIRKDKTFFFLDYQAKRQRHGIPFTGLIPTAAMMGGDYTLDPFGVARPGFPIPLASPIRTVSITSSTPIQARPSSATPQAILLRRPLPDYRPAGRPATRFPSPSPAAAEWPIRPVLHCSSCTLKAIQAMPISVTTTPTFLCGNLTKGEFDIRLDHNFSSKDSIFARFSYDQAVSFVPGGSPGFAEQGAFASTQNITNHGRNVAISETHLFSDKTINQATFGFQSDLQSHFVVRYGHLRSGKDWHSRRRSGQPMRQHHRLPRQPQPVDEGLRRMRSEFNSVDRLLVGRRSRIFALPGRHERFLGFRFAGPDPRQS
jgi:hypothetical protein